MNKIVFFLLLPFFVLSQQDNFYEILEQDEFKENINKEGRLLFDIRTMEEFNLGHIEGAINIDYYGIKKLIGTIYPIFISSLQIINFNKSYFF